jgi:hypothetical protein
MMTSCGGVQRPGSEVATRDSLANGDGRGLVRAQLLNTLLKGIVVKRDTKEI